MRQSMHFSLTKAMQGQLRPSLCKQTCRRSSLIKTCRNWEIYLSENGHLWFASVDNVTIYRERSTSWKKRSTNYPGLRKCQVEQILALWTKVFRLIQKSIYSKATWSQSTRSFSILCSLFCFQEAMTEVLRFGTMKQEFFKTLSEATQTMSQTYHSIAKVNYWLPPAKISK